MSNNAERRAKQTIQNLIFSMLATLGIVALIVLGVPRDDRSLIQRIDYESVAKSAEGSLGEKVLSPSVPDDWWSNAARLEKQLGLDVWFIGFVTAENQFIGLSQAFESNASWEADVLAGNALVGEVEVGGLVWEIYPTRTPSDPPGTREYAMLHSFGSSTVIIYGTAPESDFNIMAEAIALELGN